MNYTFYPTRQQALTAVDAYRSQGFRTVLWKCNVIRYEVRYWK